MGASTAPDVREDTSQAPQTLLSLSYTDQETRL